MIVADRHWWMSWRNEGAQGLTATARKDQAFISASWLDRRPELEEILSTLWQEIDTHTRIIGGTDAHHTPAGL